MNDRPCPYYFSSPMSLKAQARELKIVAKSSRCIHLSYGKLVLNHIITKQDFIFFNDWKVNSYFIT